MNPELHCRSKHDEDPRPMVYQLKNSANREWKETKKRKGSAVNKVERILRSEESCNIRHADTEFSAYPTSFWFYFDPVFPYHASFPTF